MARIFEDGFDDGTLNKWTGTKILSARLEVSSISPYKGLYHLLTSNLVIQSQERAQVFVSLTPATRLLYARAYVQFASGLPLNPSASPTDPLTRVAVIWFYGGNNTTGIGGAKIEKRAGGDELIISCVTKAGTVMNGRSGIYPVMGRYYCVEVMLKIGVGNGEMRLWIDGQEVASIVGIDNSQYDIDAVRFGTLHTWLDHEVPVYEDQCVVGDSYIGQDVELPQLTVRASPELGVPVYVDEQFVGNTPVAVLLSKGTHTVRVEEEVSR
jgi:hypothetical protein